MKHLIQFILILTTLSFSMGAHADDSGREDILNKIIAQETVIDKLEQKLHQQEKELGKSTVLTIVLGALYKRAVTAISQPQPFDTRLSKAMHSLVILGLGYYTVKNGVNVVEIPVSKLPETFRTLDTAKKNLEVLKKIIGEK